MSEAVGPRSRLTVVEKQAALTARASAEARIFLEQPQRYWLTTCRLQSRAWLFFLSFHYPNSSGGHALPGHASTKWTRSVQEISALSWLAKSGCRVSKSAQTSGHRRARDANTFSDDSSQSNLSDNGLQYTKTFQEVEWNLVEWNLPPKTGTYYKSHGVSFVH